MIEETSQSATVEKLRAAVETADINNQPEPAAEVPESKEKKKNKGPGSSRGVETMFRVSYDNNLQMIKLADNKANTLIGINGMIISVIIALVSPRIEFDTWLLAPSVVLLLGCLTSLAMAIMSSRPRLITTDIDIGQVLSNEANVLFFGNFTRLTLQEFLHGMDHLMADRRLLYDNMIRDIYFMGLVLTRKYYFLRHAYTAFMVTLALSVIIFVAVFVVMATR